MIEHRGGEALTWRSVSYETKIGSRAVDMTVILPIGGAPTGIVHPLIPGLGARQEVYKNLGIALAERGHTAALIAYDGCSSIGGQAVEYALSSLEDGSFRGQAVPVEESDLIIPVAHSLGPRKLVTALERMKERGSNIQHAIIEAPACLQGVHPVWAPLDAVRSIHQEMRHIEMSGAIQHRKVALDALRAMLSLRAHLPHEIHVAMHDSIESRIAALQEQGIRFAAVDHPDDILVSAQKNQPAYRRLGIEAFSVDAPLAGHVVPLYYPYQTATAIETAQTSLTVPHSTAA